MLEKSKIGKVSPYPCSSYPLIRLPHQCGDFIEKTARIFKAEHQGSAGVSLIFLESGENLESR